MTRITQRLHIASQDYGDNGRYISCQAPDGSTARGTNDAAYFRTFTGSSMVKSLPLSKDQLGLVGTEAADPLTEEQALRLEKEGLTCPEFLTRKRTLALMGSEHVAFLLDRVSVPAPQGGYNSFRSDREWASTLKLYSTAARKKDANGSDYLTNNQRDAYNGRLRQLADDLMIEGLAGRFARLSGASNEQQQQPQAPRLPASTEASQQRNLTAFAENILITAAKEGTDEGVAGMRLAHSGMPYNMIPGYVRRNWPKTS